MNTNKDFDTAILLLVFNRPETTEQVFQKIRAIRPKQLYIAADGPRPNNQSDYDKIEAVKQIVNTVDWVCDVKKLYRETNLGCGKAISGGITWFFEHVNEGIILEDDCLPDLTFFSFCKELLKKYRFVDKIMHISGSNFHFGNKYDKYSYFFNGYSSVWGWATWKRAWKHYDYNTNFKFADKLNFYKQGCVEQYFWNRYLTKTHNFEIDTWDYQWLFSMWNAQGLAITPINNLVSNIGFGNNATHTFTENSMFSKMPTEPIFELKHPEKILLNRKADTYIYRQNFKPNYYQWALRKIKNTLTPNHK